MITVADDPTVSNDGMEFLLRAFFPSVKIVYMPYSILGMYIHIIHPELRIGSYRSEVGKGAGSLCMEHRGA